MTLRKIVGALLLGLLIFGVRALSHADDSLWIRHSGFDVLSRGSAGDGGQNLYVSRGGRVQTIQRLDFNVDGEIDLLFTQDHDHVYAPDVLVYWGGPEGFHSLQPDLWQLRSPFNMLKWLDRARDRVTRLPGLGGGRAAIADLNADDYPDIVFANAMHNYRPDQAAYIYWGGAAGFHSERRTELPAYRASGVAVGDLNGDHIPEVVLANEGDERGESWGFRLHLESFIYWGSADGYAVDRRSSLPTISAADVALGDFNGDGAADLAFVNSNSEVASLFVYWNDGQGGFSKQRRQIFDRAALRLAESNETRTRYGMHALLAARIDDDRYSELVVGGSDHVLIYSGSARGLEREAAVLLSANNCRGIEAADLNGDGRPELVIANEGERESSPSESAIFWASADGYDPERRTELPTLGAASVDVADLNGDGNLDILFGNGHDDERSDVPSYIYWGGANGYSRYRRSDLFGFGTIGSGAADLNRDGRLDVLLVSHLSGRNGSLPPVIFWGNPDHAYSSVSATILDMHPHMEYSAGDLDDDGYPDLVFLGDDGGNALVWWGAAGGFLAENRTRVSVESPMSSSIADLNGDGHLDILFVVPASARSVRKARAVILWGNADRFAGARTREWELAATGNESNAIADLNRDGHLDLIFPISLSDVAEIYWGGVNGYEEERRTRLPAHSAPHAVVADLDGDEWLDLIFTSGATPGKFTVNTPTYVYWGSAGGYSAASRSELEGYTGLDACVSDFNRDGRLDIAMTNYRSDTNRKAPTFVYWGGEGRDYSDKRRALLRAGSGSAVTALDLNRDGWPELIASNHQFDFDHSAGSDIFWGGPDGFSLSRRTHLPTVGVHLDDMVDAGNVYDRRCEWDYVGPAIERASRAIYARIHWKAEAPLGTGLKFQVRSANDERGLAGAAWRGPQGPQSYYEKSGSTLVGIPRGHGWLEYRAVLFSPDGANSAFLTEVAIECEKRGAKGR